MYEESLATLNANSSNGRSKKIGDEDEESKNACSCDLPLEQCLVTQYILQFRQKKNSQVMNERENLH